MIPYFPKGNFRVELQNSAAMDIQEAAADLVLQKRLPVMDIVTHRFPLDRIQEALELAARPTAESLKILITHA